MAFSARPLFIVFVVAAIATAVAHVSKAAKPYGLLLELVPLVAIVVATLNFIVHLRRVSPSRMRTALVAYTYLAGAVVGTFGVGHLVAVVMVSLDRVRQHQFVYDFRVYSLLLLGALLIAAGLMAAIHAARLAEGHPAAWRASVAVWIGILAINLPLVSIQGFAMLFAALAALALIALTGMRWSVGFDPRPPNPPD